jgi:hypothetical protein
LAFEVFQVLKALTISSPISQVFAILRGLSRPPPRARDKSKSLVMNRPQIDDDNDDDAAEMARLRTASSYVRPYESITRQTPVDDQDTDEERSTEEKYIVLGFVRSHVLSRRNIDEEIDNEARSMLPMSFGFVSLSTHTGTNKSFVERKRKVQELQLIIRNIKRTKTRQKFRF